MSVCELVPRKITALFHVLLCAITLILRLWKSVVTKTLFVCLFWGNSSLVHKIKICGIKVLGSYYMSSIKNTLFSYIYIFSQMFLYILTYTHALYFIHIHTHTLTKIGDVLSLCIFVCMCVCAIVSTLTLRK